VESLLGKAEVSSLETTVPVRKGITFYPTVGSPLKFYRSFRMLFSLEQIWNHYSVTRWSRRSRPELRFERAITFDPTVGSPSNFFWSFRTLFHLE